MRKTGRTKALLAMFLAAASLQAGTAFGAQAATGSQLQAGTWVKEDAGWKYRKPSGEMATGWVHTASGWYYLQPETGIMATGMLRINDRTYYFNQTPDASLGRSLISMAQAPHFRTIQLHSQLMGVTIFPELSFKGVLLFNSFRTLATELFLLPSNSNPCQ